MIPPFVKKLLEMRSFLLINLVVLFFLSLSFGRTFWRNTSIQNEIDALEAEKAELESQNLELLSLADQLQTKFYLEKEGRKKYGLQRDGERLVIVTETLGEESESQESKESRVEESNESAKSTDTAPDNLDRWWFFFFDREAYAALRDDQS